MNYENNLFEFFIINYITPYVSLVKHIHKIRIEEKRKGKSIFSFFLIKKLKYVTQNNYIILLLYYVFGALLTR